MTREWDDILCLQAITTGCIVLEPLTVAHAEAMFQVLADPLLYRHLDESAPASVEELRRIYTARQSRKSPDRKQLWLNWVIRVDGQAPVGYVQATVTGPGVAWVAFVVASRHWGRGLGFRASNAMLAHLELVYGVRHCMATVEIDNQRSIRLLQRLGFQPATPSEAGAHALSETERLFLLTRIDRGG